MPRPIQALLLLLLLAAAVRAAAPDDLAQDCNALSKTAIQKPYGWALPSSAVSSRPIPRGAALVDLRQTATAAILLEMAGKDLADDAFRNAAAKFAWGLAAAQQTGGRIPSLALFAGSASSHDPLTELADRSSTNPSLLALLLVLQSNPSDHRLHSASMRAAQWLARQQTVTGAFPTPFAKWSDPQPIRLLRLDRTDYRDATLALIAAGYVHQTADLRFNLNRAIESLLKLRSDSLTANGLWESAYDLSGTPSEAFDDRANCIDTLACRYTMQALLTASLLLKNPDASAALDQAAKTLPKMRYQDGLFLRLYPLRNNEIPALHPGPAPRPPDLFKPEFKPPEDLRSPGTFGLPPLLDTLASLKTGQTSLNQLSQPFTPLEQIALVLAGLSDELLTTDLPHTPQAARAWIANDRKSPFSSPPPAGETGQLYLSLLRERIAHLASL